MKNVKYLLAGFAVGVVGLTALTSTWGTIDSGHRGIVKRMGKVTGEIKGEGFFTKKPFVEEVIEIDIRTKKEQVQTSSASKDLQVVDVVTALNFSLDEKRIAGLYQTVGENFLEVSVGPSLREAIMAGVSKYTAEELITKRELVRAEVVRLVSAKLEPLGIRTEAVNIVNFNFSKSFNDAIENKVTAEQDALAAKNKLEQKRYEAEQVVVTAKGAAEALRVTAAAIAASPSVLKLEAIKKWDGTLPRYMGGNAPIPFIDVK